MPYVNLGNPISVNMNNKNKKKNNDNNNNNKNNNNNNISKPFSQPMENVEHILTYFPLNTEDHGRTQAEWTYLT